MGNVFSNKSSYFMGRERVHPLNSVHSSAKYIFGTPAIKTRGIKELERMIGPSGSHARTLSLIFQFR